jgi:hypothetical protein
VITINRRQVVAAGLAASALAVTRAGYAMSSDAILAKYSVGRVLVDERFEEAKRLAKGAVNRGIEVVALPRDVLVLWHKLLLPSLTREAQALAGVTTQRGLFLLQTLAADHRLRVVYRAEHSQRAHLGRVAARPESLVTWVISPRTRTA